MPEQTLSDLTLSEPLPREGVSVPVRATFVGLKGVPLLSLGHNNLRPVFRLFSEGIETRVFRLRRRPYSAIEQVGVLSGPWTRNVEIVWRDSILLFAANVREEAWRLAVLRFLAGRGAPLTRAARNLLKT